MRHVSRWIALLAALAALTCVRGSGHDPTLQSYNPPKGTCEGACDNYVDCRGLQSDEIHRSCIADCRELYEDATMLGKLERLSCEDVIAFVDGDRPRSRWQN